MKNNDHIDKFISDIESIKMTHTEKNEIRNNLALFAINYKAQLSPYANVISVARRSVALAFIAVLSVGSLSSYISQDALPGETLYPVKIAHEELTSATKSNTQKKINYEITLTKKRIQEAIILAQHDELNPDLQNTIAKKIKIQTQKVQTSIEEVKIENPEEALILNSELKSVVKANSDALRQVTTEKKLVVEDIHETNEVETKELEELPENQDTGTNEESLVSDTHTQTEVREAVTEEEVSIEAVTEEEVSIEAVTEEEVSIEDREKAALPVEVIEYANVSFAEALLDSIQEDIVEIEAFEEVIIDEIIKEEVSTEAVTEEEITLDLVEIDDTAVENQTDAKLIDLETPEELVSDPVAETLTSQEYFESILNEEVIETEVATLELIRDIENQIKYLKGESTENHIHIETIKLADDSQFSTIFFDEFALRNEAELYAKEGNYQKAFILLETILSHLKEELIVQEIQNDLGIELEPTSEIAESKLPEIETISTHADIEIIIQE